MPDNRERIITLRTLAGEILASSAKHTVNLKDVIVHCAATGNIGALAPILKAVNGDNIDYVSEENLEKFKIFVDGYFAGKSAK